MTYRDYLDTIPSYGQIAYEAYGESTGGLTYDGREMPKWEDLTPKIQRAWQTAALTTIVKFGQALLPKEKD